MFRCTDCLRICERVWRGGFQCVRDSGVWGFGGLEVIDDTPAAAFVAEAGAGGVFAVEEFYGVAEVHVVS